MLMDTWENGKTIPGDDKHEQKEHVGIISLYRDAVTFIKIGQVIKYDRPKQTKVNKILVTALLTPKKIRILPFHITLEEIIQCLGSYTQKGWDNIMIFLKYGLVIGLISSKKKMK